MKKVGIALLGLGTVGGGTYRILKEQRENIKRLYDVDIEVLHILEKNMDRVAELGVDPSIVSTDISNVTNNADITIVAEFFGGIEPARSFLLQALESGKSIVTANKELFSKHWQEFEGAASKSGAGLYFEASCVGGVPIIRALSESMQGNNILSLKGIVNGTTNYILSAMSDSGTPYQDALKKAQELGYAEFNPTADVEGFDSTYKLSILSTLAYNKPVPIQSIYREGITKISVDDIAFGKQLGYTLKLLAISKCQGNVEAHVYPAFIPNDDMLAGVKGSYNGITVVGNNVEQLTFFGRGAGDLPTGSAIVSDIVYCATKEKHRRYPQVLSDALSVEPNFSSEYYLRVQNAFGVESLIEKHGLTILDKVCPDTKNTIFILAKSQESTIKALLTDISTEKHLIRIER